MARGPVGRGIDENRNEDAPRREERFAYAMGEWAWSLELQARALRQQAVVLRELGRYMDETLYRLQAAE